MWKLYFLSVVFITAAAHCTTILSVYSPDGVYIAADSKVSEFGNDRFECKIHVLPNAVWAAAGLLKSPTFDIASLVEKELRPNRTFDEGIANLRGDLAKQEPIQRDDYVKRGGKFPENIHWETLVVSRIAPLRMYRFDVPDSGITPDCPDVNCRPGVVLISGTGARVAEIGITDPQFDVGVSIEQRLMDLIKEQARATPETVGGKISVVRVDQSGVHWLSIGECAAEAAKP